MPANDGRHPACGVSLTPQTSAARCRKSYLPEGAAISN